MVGHAVDLAITKTVESEETDIPQQGFLPRNVTMANAAEQSVKFRSIFVLKWDEWFENFDPTVPFFVRLAAEKSKKENKPMRRWTARRSDRCLQWKVITASISFAFAWESSGVIDDWRTKREISSRKRLCSGRSNVSCSRYSNSWFVSLMFKQIYRSRKRSGFFLRRNVYFPNGQSQLIVQAATFGDVSDWS